MATLCVLRRCPLRGQMSIREIARRTGLSLQHRKKYLRAGEKMPRYAQRTSSSMLDPYADTLGTWLAIKATKSRKQRRNLREIHIINLKRRTTSTYPHREAFRLTKRVGQYSMEILGSAIGGIRHALLRQNTLRCERIPTRVAEAAFGCRSRPS